MLRLAQKAFYPGPIPFPLLHIDTGWKFREMIAFRERIAEELGVELLRYTNPRGVAEGIGPFSPWLRLSYRRHEDRSAQASPRSLRL
jgi:sulfate adenylyltransferase subunit 2